jgi:hypothetical protein
MQGDGNLVLYHEGGAVWATYTSGSGNFLVMEPEGNLVVYHGGTALWNSTTWGFPGADLQLQNDGNLVVYENGHAIWTYGSGYKGHLLNANEDLQPGAYLLSPDHEYQLIMQGDGNLVLYHGGSAVWATYTSGSGDYLAMQPEGNLVVYNGGGTAQWNTGTWGFAGGYLQLQDDGNVVVYQNGHAVWTYGSGYKGQILNPNERLQPGAYLLSPNHEYELVMQGEGNLVLYHGGSALWATYTSGSGDYATMQTDGNLVVYDGGAAQWSSATSGSSGAYLQLQDDSNLVIYLGGTAIWDWESGKIGGGGGGRSAIVTAAESQDQHGGGIADVPANSGCNPYSAYFGDGSSCGGGLRANEWCADFAAWAWRQGGVSFTYGGGGSDINAWSASFYKWGVATGNWHPLSSGSSPQPGDVAVYGNLTEAPGPGHVGIYVGGAASSPTVVNGNWATSWPNPTNYGVIIEAGESNTGIAGGGLDGYVSP